MKVKLVTHESQNVMDFANCRGENAPCIYSNDDDATKSVSDQYNKGGPVHNNNGGPWMQDLDQDSNLGTLVTSLWSQAITVDSAKGKGALKNYALIYDLVGGLYFQRIYKSGFCEIIPFTPVLKGAMRYRTVKIVGVDSLKFFSVYFVGSDKYVFGDLNKRKKQQLYETFKRANVVFHETLSEEEIGTVLRNALLEKIDKATRTLKIEYYAGWSEGVYIEKKTFRWKEEILFCDFPVNQKKLTRMKMTEESILRFIDGMQKIPDINVRLFSLVYPVAAIMASIFAEEGLQLNVSLNFIADSEFSSRIICNYFQILNREKLRPISGEVTQNEFKEVIGSYKDETLILDCRNFFGNSQNQNTKNNGSLHSAHNIFLGKKFENNLELQPFGLITISEKFCSGIGIVNQYVDEESFGLGCIDNQIISELFFELVDFIENSQERIRQIIICHKQKNNDYDAIFESVHEILKVFWCRLGYDFSEAFLLPTKIDFSEIVRNTSVEDEEILDVFVSCFRKAAFSYEACEMRHPWTDKPLLRYDAEYIAVPSVVLDEILKKAGLFDRKIEILRRIKQDGNLKTDANPWLYRVSINKVTKKLHFFKKDFLNATGKSDIVLCFKEVE